MSGENFDAELVKEHIRRILRRLREQRIKPPNDQSKEADTPRDKDKTGRVRVISPSRTTGRK
jgi:hypothetical protein